MRPAYPSLQPCAELPDLCNKPAVLGNFDYAALNKNARRSPAFRPEKDSADGQRCRHAENADTNAAKVQRKRGIALLREGVKAKPVKRAAVWRKKNLNVTGAGGMLQHVCAAVK